MRRALKWVIVHWTARQLQAAEPGRGATMAWLDRSGFMAFIDARLDARGY